MTLRSESRASEIEDGDDFGRVDETRSEPVGIGDGRMSDDRIERSVVVTQRPSPPASGKCPRWRTVSARKQRYHARVRVGWSTQEYIIDTWFSRCNPRRDLPRRTFGAASNATVGTAPANVKFMGATDRRRGNEQCATLAYRHLNSRDCLIEQRVNGTPSCIPRP
jgi:hypothetical protein